MPALRRGAALGVAGDQDRPAGVGRFGGPQRVAESSDVGAEIGGVAEQAELKR